MLGAGGHAHAAVETHRHHRARDMDDGGVARAALSRARALASRALHRLALDCSVPRLRGPVRARSAPPAPLLLALAAVMALALVLLRCNGYEGALLALI